MKSTVATHPTKHSNTRSKADDSNERFVRNGQTGWGVMRSGWADDDLIGAYGYGVAHGLEAYSGDVTGEYIGVDETPEQIGIKVQWSIMMRGQADDFSTSSRSRYAVSIEELSTVDFKHIPSSD